MVDQDGLKRIIIIAGPNGAGKTTFAKEFLPNEADCLHFAGVKSMKADDIDKARNPLLRLALPALQRAALKAREQAILHNTRLILWRENQVVRLSADEIREQGADYTLE